MIPFLTFSYHHIFPNYGLAIILLTVVIKAIFYPLTNKQYTSMKKMQDLQPLLKELQEKLKKQPEKLQKEIMGFYKSHKVNPLSGCLPLLVQLPFFFAIYYTIGSPGFKELLTAPGVNPGIFSFWVPNLELPDHSFILPMVIAVSTYFSQKLMTMDPQQAKIFAFMPIFMFFISISMPSGVLLYWSVSQILSYLQQWWILKTYQKTTALTV